MKKRTKASPATAGSPRIGILVVGMHRSGTSALTRVLSLLGCDLPATLMAPNKGNESGYWESSAIYRFNERLLESAGTSWDDWLAFNADWLRSPKSQPFYDEAGELLRAEFGSSRLFVLKDPRVCRILPFWLHVLKQADVRPLIVASVRNPQEVASSLETRNGFDPAFSHLLWLRHVLDAEFESRGVPRFFTGYDRLMKNWSRLAMEARARLGVAWPRMSDRTASEIEEFLSGKLRHHETSADDVIKNPLLSSWLRDTFAILNRWAESGEKPKDRATLDRIRAEFNAATPAFSRAIATGRKAAVRSQTLEKGLDEAKEAIGAHEKQVSDLQAEIQSARQEASRKEREIADLKAQTASELQAAQKTLADVRDRLAKTESALIQRQHESEQTAGELARVRAELRDASSARAQDRKLISELQSQLAEKNAAREAEAAEKRQLATKLEERVDEIATLTRLLAEKDAARKAEAAEKRQLATKLEERVDEIAALTRLSRERSESMLAQQKKLEHAHRSQLTHAQRKAANELYQLRHAAALEFGRAFAAMSGGRRWSFLSRRQHLNWQMALLEQCGLFDRKWYLSHYKDVADAGIDPLLHYIKHGAKEGRAPNPRLLGRAKTETASGTDATENA